MSRVQIPEVPYCVSHSFGSEFLPDFLDNLSKHKLAKLCTFVNSVYRIKYRPKSRKTKYGNINKGFTEEELDRFLSSVKHPKAYLAFLLQSHLGLRVSEAVSIKIDDINFSNNKIRISTLKAKTGDILRMPVRVQKFLKVWVQKHIKSIEKHQGYILFSSNPKQKRLNISPHWLRKIFRETCIVANLNEFYDYADDTRNRFIQKGRKLHRLTTHSLRHYYITKCYNHCKNPVLTQKLARHTDLQSTQTYININLEKMDKVIDEVFAPQNNKDKEEITEFMQMYMKFKKMKM